VSPALGASAHGVQWASLPSLPTDIAAELVVLEAELKRLEAEYNMFFGGRLPRPPWETRGRVEAMMKRLDRTSISNYGERFRFSTLQSRLAAFVDLWDRGLRAREEGRPGPFASAGRAERRSDRSDGDKTLHVTTVKDPLREIDKLHDLYNRLVAAKGTEGKQAMPFHKFAELVKTQVSSFKEKGTGEVALRVAVRSGKLALTARPLKPGEKPKRGEE
jgi:hypothetical protein